MSRDFACPPEQLRRAAAQRFRHAPAEGAWQAIATVHAPWTWREEAPRQGLDPAAGAVISLRPGMQNLLKDLDGFERMWVLAWFHRSNGWNQQVVPPRDRVKRGLLATRSPDRPNPIGLSCVTIAAISGTRIWITGHDLLDGTPVLDLKPYIPAYDSFPGARAGWVDGLTDPGPDHRVPAGLAAERRVRGAGRWDPRDAPATG